MSFPILESGNAHPRFKSPAGVPRKLTSISKKVLEKKKTARQLCIFISKMMGHTKEETTKHYYNVDIPEIIEGTKNVDFLKLEFEM